MWNFIKRILGKGKYKEGGNTSSETTSTASNIIATTIYVPNTNIDEAFLRERVVLAIKDWKVQAPQLGEVRACPANENHVNIIVNSITGTVGK